VTNFIAELVLMSSDLPQLSSSWFLILAISEQDLSLRVMLNFDFRGHLSFDLH